jgi:hypothetical protein
LDVCGTIARTKVTVKLSPQASAGFKKPAPAQSGVLKALTGRKRVPAVNKSVDAVDHRPSARNDLKAVEEIIRAAYMRYIARIGREPGPMLDDYAAVIDAGHVHIAERDGTVQGIIHL